ncbi:MAG: hypothetical protein K0R17_557 [Rariglobus sp.]|nr:hypothetical protein [Rariglobus sp.]
MTRRAGALNSPDMINLPEDELTFLTDLVKTSRQKPHRVDWVDRDGTERSTLLSPADASRLNKLAHGLKISKAETLRQAAHIPVKK